MLVADQNEPRPPTHPILILIAGFVSAVLLFFCCACGGAFWWFRPEVYEDPIRAEQLTSEIIDVQLPATYRPKGTIEMNVLYALRVRGVYYERIVGDGILTLIEVNSRFQADEDVRLHIRQTLMEKGGGGTPLIMDEAAAKSVQVDINGKPVTFSFEVGSEPPPSHRMYHIVEGVFTGKQGEVLLAMRVSDDDWEETSVIDMLQSIGDSVSEEAEPAAENAQPVTAEPSP